MNTQLILTVSFLHILAVVSPGPDFVLTIRNSLCFGRKMGYATAVGFGLGIAIHVSYSILGVAILIQRYPQIYQVVKTLGAGYLIWIGLTTLWSHRGNHLSEDVKPLSELKAQSVLMGIRQGFFTNLLNPKATLFILGLFTSVIPLETELSTMLTCGAVIILITIFWFMLVSFFFGAKKIRVTYLKAEKVISTIFAIFFIATGIWILTR